MDPKHSVIQGLHCIFICSEIFDEERYRQEEEMQRDNRRVQAISWGRSNFIALRGPIFPVAGVNFCVAIFNLISTHVRQHCLNISEHLNSSPPS